MQMVKSTPEVFVRPTESVGQDGNTVDVDEEMGRLAQNQIMYRSAVELLNRKIGTLKYAISAGVDNELLKSNEY